MLASSPDEHGDGGGACRHRPLGHSSRDTLAAPFAGGAFFCANSAHAKSNAPAAGPARLP